jgi:hypothetical protein
MRLLPACRLHCPQELSPNRPNLSSASWRRTDCAIVPPPTMRRGRAMNSSHANHQAAGCRAG